MKGRRGREATREGAQVGGEILLQSKASASGSAREEPHTLSEKQKKLVK
jgi:hypothetical protein